MASHNKLKTILADIPERELIVALGYIVQELLVRPKNNLTIKKKAKRKNVKSK